MASGVLRTGVIRDTPTRGKIIIGNVCENIVLVIIIRGKCRAVLSPEEIAHLLGNLTITRSMKQLFLIGAS